MTVELRVALQIANCSSQNGHLFAEKADTAVVPITEQATYLELSVSVGVIYR